MRSRSGLSLACTDTHEALPATASPLMHSLVFLLLACLGLALADPTPPGYSYLYTVNATLAPAIEVGPGPQGDRRVIPIIGGEFTGPKLKGELCSGGGALEPKPPLVSGSS